MAMLEALALIGTLAVSFMMWVFLHLSMRLGRIGHVPPFYRVLYTSIFLMLITLIAQALYHFSPPPAADNLLWTLLLLGFPAASLTITLSVIWRYWSWLLAERG